MSASLVGSEMCIRDRLPPPPPPPQRIASQTSVPFQAGSRQQQEGGQDSCLLYTSDAADDM
eukprot:9207268-Alexandrium_andersonii.AAC.1